MNQVTLGAYGCLLSYQSVEHCKQWRDILDVRTAHNEIDNIITQHY